MPPDLIFPPWSMARFMRRLFGRTSQRPSRLYTGGVYFDIDESALLVWNGAAWQYTTRPGWIDLGGDVNHAAAVAGMTYEAYRDTPFLHYFFHRSQDDSISLLWQMPHAWDRGPVFPHLHLTPCGPDAGNAIFDGRYAWSHVGTLAKPTWANWTTFTVTEPIAAADQWIPRITGLAGTTGWAPPTTAQYPSAILSVYLQRRGSSNALDTYHGDKPDHTAAANILLEAVDCHVRVDGTGTKGLYA